MVIIIFLVPETGEKSSRKWNTCEASPVTLLLQAGWSSAQPVSEKATQQANLIIEVFLNVEFI